MNDLKKILGNKKGELLGEYFSSHDNIMTVYLFGSYGTKYQTQNSDIDLAILFREDLSLMDDMQIGAELELILSPEEVDVTNLNKAGVVLQHRILSQGIKIYEREPIFTANFIEKTLKKYFDFGIEYRKIFADFYTGLKEEYSYDS